MPIRTIFLMSEECARGERLGWSEFVRDYADVVTKLLLQFFPVLSPEIDTHVANVFQRAHADQNAWFSSLQFANEREFLMPLRQLVFSYGREVARMPTPQISLAQMKDIMQDLTVVEREILWLFVKGYTAEQIAPILMNAIATATAVKQKADERLATLLPSAGADSFRLSARVLIEEAEKTRSEQCLPLKTFNNLINGQITWRERELAEEHIRDCFNCLDRYTAFQEMIRLRKDAQPLPGEKVEQILADLNIAAKSQGFFSRIFARA
jgi:hypothetical protein